MQRTKTLLIKSALGFGLVLLLAGCLGNNQPQIEQPLVIDSNVVELPKPIQKPDLTLPPVDELNMREVKWVVINEDNVEAVIEQLKARDGAFAVYALTGEGYGNLGLNFSDIRALVQQQQAIIAAYENYYKQAEEAIEEHNQSVNE